MPGSKKDPVAGTLPISALKQLLNPGLPAAKG